MAIYKSSFNKKPEKEVEKKPKKEKPKLIVIDPQPEYSEKTEISNDIVEQINDLTEQKKELENEMRIHKSTYVYTDLNTGESYEVNPPFRTASTQVVVTIKK